LKQLKSQIVNHDFKHILQNILLKKKSYALVAPNSVFGLEVVNW
jgi:hypothetical protein